MRVELRAFYWRLVAANGKILAHSEQYASRSNARRAAKRAAKALKLPLIGRTIAM